MIKIHVVDGGKVPEYKTVGAACADCYARLSTSYIIVPAGSRCLVNLGFKLELPIGYEAQIRPRSGLTKTALDVGLGTIDCDYRGEVKACVINNTGNDYTINNLDRICQMYIGPAKRYEFEVVDELSKTVRGESGFGSTGV